MSYQMPNPFCTCHPDDNPPRPCPQKFAYSECVTVDMKRLWSEMQVMSDWAAAQILREEGLQRMEFGR